MRRVKPWMTIAVLVLLVSCGSGSPRPGDIDTGAGGNVTGLWAASLTTAGYQGPISTFGMTLNQTGTTVTGSVTSVEGNYIGEGVPISGNSNGTGITLVIGSAGQSLTVNGRVGAEGRLITGTIPVQTESGSLELDFLAGRED